jgi:hypothetical protein
MVTDFCTRQFKNRRAKLSRRPRQTPTGRLLPARQISQYPIRFAPTARIRASDSRESRALRRAKPLEFCRLRAIHAFGVQKGPPLSPGRPSNVPRPSGSQIQPVHPQNRTSAICRMAYFLDSPSPRRHAESRFARVGGRSFDSLHGVANYVEPRLVLSQSFPCLPGHEPRKDLAGQPHHRTSCDWRRDSILTPTRFDAVSL